MHDALHFPILLRFPSHSPVRAGANTAGRISREHRQLEDHEIAVLIIEESVHAIVRLLFINFV